MDVMNNSTTTRMFAAHILPGDVVEGFVVSAVHVGPTNFRGSRKVTLTGPQGQIKICSDAGRFLVTRAS